MKPELRVLLLEDNPYDAQLIEHELERAGFVLSVHRVDTEKGFLEYLEHDPQIILADYTLPAYNALDALRTMRERDLDIPFVVVTGTLDEERAMACVREGCTDYLLKDRLTRLGQVVTQALEQTRMRAEVRAQQQRVEASERRFRAMIENGGESHILLDRDGFILYSSKHPAIETPHDEMVGKRIVEFLEPHEVSRVMDALRELVAAGLGASYRSEYEARAHSGRRGAFSVCAINMLADPNVEAIVLTLTDITEARRTRDALEQSERRYRSLFEKTRSVICTHTLDGQIVSVNPAVGGILGFGPEELVGNTGRCFLSPQDFEAALAGRELLERDGHYRGVTKAIHKDGSERYLAFENFLEDERGGQRLVTTHAVDVTDLEVARRQLRRYTEQLQSMVAATNHFMRTRDWQEAVKVLLQGMRTLTRSRVAFLALVTGPERVILTEPSGECSESHMLPLWELLEKEADDAVVFLDGHMAIPLLVDACRVGMLGACDATRTLVQPEMVQGLAQTASLIYGAHVNQDHEELLHVELRESQKMEAVGRLAGGIAHDFNNMLTGILGFADIAEGELEPAHPAHAALAEVKGAAERALTLTRQLLTFGRRQILHLEVLDVNALLRRVCSMLERTLGEDVSLELDLSADTPLVVGDASSLEQVVMNLAINARDAMPCGGRLTIGTQLLEGHEAACGNGKTVVQLHVTDTGCGMEDAVKAHIFEPFFTTKDASKGSGLGLPTLLGIVQQLGGCIAVHSVVDVGTRFDIQLPLADPTTPTQTQPSAVQGHETVLVVEDEDMVRKLVRVLLTEAGYRVIEARTAEEALYLGETLPEAVDLVIADVVLPTLSGREVAERLKARWPSVAVIYTSGHNEDVVVSYDVSRHQVPFLQKPFTRQRLLQTVRQSLTSRVTVEAEA